MRAGVYAGVVVYRGGGVVYRGGRGVILAHAIYGGIYSDMAGGGFFSGYYMADFIGVNGAFLKNVHKIA